jgi:hypothetical protein
MMKTGDSFIVLRDGVLVFTGEVEGDVEAALRRARDERLAAMGSFPLGGGRLGKGEGQDRGGLR